MIVLVILFGSLLLFRLLGFAGVERFATWKLAAVHALALLFLFTASAHFNRTRHDLARMVPAIFPAPMLFIYATGVSEILGSLGLILPSFRTSVGLCLIALLVAMFPANVKAAREGLLLRGKPVTRPVLRLPIQLLLIALLLWVSGPWAF